MKEDNEKKLYKLLAKILNIPVKNINNKTSPENASSWDSFNSLMIIAELEKQFKVNFMIEEVANIKNVGDIKKYLENRGVKF